MSALFLAWREEPGVIQKGPSTSFEDMQAGGEEIEKNRQGDSDQLVTCSPYARLQVVEKPT